MSGQTSSEYRELNELANDLLDVLYFSPQHLIDCQGAAFIVSDIIDVLPLEDQKACAIRILTDDYRDLKQCGGVFNRLESVFIIIPDEATATAISDSLAVYYPNLSQYVAPEEAFGEYTGVRQLIEDGGNDALDKLVVSSKERTAIGIIRLSDVKPPKYRNATMSGIREIDSLVGGFYGGELSIWTGTRGSGKSTLLGQLLLESIDQGNNVCAYSGELPAWQFREWELLQAAGPEHVHKEINPKSGKEYYLLNDGVAKKIDAWWSNHFWLYDNTIAAANDEDSILSVFELALRRYRCTTFLCDNLMTARFPTSEKDFFRAQSSFTGRLVEFAKKNNVHVHLVAHPRKQQGRLTAEDVGGSGDITNRADNVFSMTRLSDEARDNAGFDTGLEVLKNRSSGATGGVSLDFDQSCRRFYHAGGTSNRRYSWDDGFREIADNGDMPW